MESLPVAAVLGITADIGQAIATRLMNDGWRVIGLGRSADRLDALQLHADAGRQECRQDAPAGEGRDGQ